MLALARCYFAKERARNMSCWEAIDLWHVSGTDERATHRERITGTVEIVPDMLGRGAAHILRPVEWFRKYSPDVDPTSASALRYRVIMDLTRTEAARAFQCCPGDVLVLTRTAWGETTIHRLRKI